MGRRDALQRIRRSPLLRAFRTDKTTLAALDATLAAYLAGDLTRIPFWRMALVDVAGIRSRAEAMAAGLPAAGWPIRVVDGFSTTGGGSAPTSRIPTALLRLEPVGTGAQEVAAALLGSDPPVISRIEDGGVVLDLRTVSPDDDATVGATLAAVLKTS